jgi:hypothetical protein
MKRIYKIILLSITTISLIIITVISKIDLSFVLTGGFA